jgi:hypothetical protein
VMRRRVAHVPGCPREWKCKEDFLAEGNGNEWTEHVGGSVAWVGEMRGK